MGLEVKGVYSVGEATAMKCLMGGKQNRQKVTIDKQVRICHAEMLASPDSPRSSLPRGEISHPIQHYFVLCPCGPCLGGGIALLRFFFLHVTSTRL